MLHVRIYVQHGTEENIDVTRLCILLGDRTVEAVLRILEIGREGDLVVTVQAMYHGETGTTLLIRIII